MSAIERLEKMIVAARRVVPFTGAGISTECGIPDFRSPGGYWTRLRPINFSEFLADPQARVESWKRRFAMQEQFGAARPGRGHHAVAALFRAGKAPAVITQNIDNLHQEAGMPAEAVVELHGNTMHAACLACGAPYEIEEMRARFSARGDAAPDCDCGGAIKTATISFGQAMPAAAMARGEELATRCDLFLVLGSSLVVFPAAALPLKAKQSGAQLAIVNQQETEFDSIADLVIHDDIGDVLSRAVAS